MSQSSFDFGLIDLNDDLFVALIRYLEPWTVRLLRISCTRTSSVIDGERLNRFEKELIRTRRGTRREHCCHDPNDLKYPGDVDLVKPHHCHTVLGCTVPCHRNNDFGTQHWDVTGSRTQPLKCITCGRIYVDRTIANDIFHIRNNELCSIDRYEWTTVINPPSSIRSGPKDIFLLRDVQWLSNVINRTVRPKYRYSKARERRERWLMTELDAFEVFLQGNYSFVCARALVQTMPFRYFLCSNKTLNNLKNLFGRCAHVLPTFRQIHEDASIQHEKLQTKIPSAEPFFTDMTTHDPQRTPSFQYHRLLQKSLEWSIGSAIADAQTTNEEERYGLCDIKFRSATHEARGTMFRAYAQNYPELLELVRASHVHHYLYQNFCRGEASLEDMRSTLSAHRDKCVRQRTVYDFLMSKGVSVSLLRCRVLDRYIKNGGDTDPIDVWQCVRNHIYKERLTDTSSCDVRPNGFDDEISSFYFF